MNMNRKLIVSILAIILVVAMILSLVLAALPSNIWGQTALAGVYDQVMTALPAFTGIAA